MNHVIISSDARGFASIGMADGSEIPDVERVVVTLASGQMPRADLQLIGVRLGDTHAEGRFALLVGTELRPVKRIEFEGGRIWNAGDPDPCSPGPPSDWKAGYLCCMADMLRDCENLADKSYASVVERLRSRIADERLAVKGSCDT